MEQLVSIALMIAGVYLLCGAAFTLVFQWKGLADFDHAALGAGWKFRLIITPGLIALWAVIAWKWARRASGGTADESPERPVTPRRIRRLHHTAFQMLAIALPILIGAAIADRPAHSPSTLQARCH